MPQLCVQLRISLEEQKEILIGTIHKRLHFWKVESFVHPEKLQCYVTTIQTVMNRSKQMHQIM